MSGSVGIGTSSPTQGRLVVVGGTTNSIATIAASFGTNNSIVVGDDGTNGVIGVGNSSTDMVFLKRVAGVYSEAMRITSAGNVGIGTSSPLNALDVRQANATMGNYQTIQAFSTNSAGINLGGGISLGGFYTGTSDIAQFASIVGRKENATSGNYDGYLAFGTNAQATGVVERMRITSAGNLLLGATTSDSYSGYSVMQVGGTTNGIFQTFDGTIKTAVVSNSSGFGLVGTRTNHPLSLISNDTERMRITSAGYCYLGDGWSSSSHRINLKVAQGSTILVISGYDSVGNDTAIFYASSGDSGNSAGTNLRLSRNSSTNRSINAGGTVNASGADYAEYMTKSVNDTINKGDIVGVDINGKLTNIFADSISFVIKSTDPSYVGGDVWGNEEVIGKKPFKTTDQTEEEFTIVNEVFEAKLEEARAKVDRISFSGQVPCNVLGANVGDYIIPIQTEDGKITGQAVTSPSFEQYQISVGKVWKIMEDGRAWIAVKIG